MLSNLDHLIQNWWQYLKSWGCHIFKMEIEKVCLPLKTNLQSIVRFDPSQAGAKKCIFGLKSFARTYQMDFMAAPSLELFYNIQIFKLKIFPHILFSEKRNNGSIHISFKTLKYISSENWKSEIILLFDKLMWAFLHLHYSTSFKRDLWIRGFKDYFGERHIYLRYERFE